MTGKERCSELKRIRRRIADANGIPLQIARCDFTGDCEGTCPRCEEEMRVLRESLQAIRDSGGTVVIPPVRVEGRAPFRGPDPGSRPRSGRLMGVPARPMRNFIDPWEMMKGGLSDGGKGQVQDPQTDPA